MKTRSDWLEFQLGSAGLSECLKTFSAKDESNEPSVALYKKGLNEFEKALQVPIPGHGLNQDKANELKSRIRRSVIQIKDWGPIFIFFVRLKEDRLVSTSSWNHDEGKNS